MFRYKYSAEKIVEVLAQLENKGRADAEFYKKHGVKLSTVSEWKKKFTRLSVERIEYIRGLEEQQHHLKLENERLKSQNTAAIAFLVEKIPDVKERRVEAKRLFEKGLIGQTDVCGLFSIKWNSFKHNSER